MSEHEKIKDILCTIHEILELGSEKDWCHKFYKLIKLWEMSESVSERKHVAREIKSLYGGMGSLNDLIIYRDKIVALEENDQLDRLRSELFDGISKILVS
jgi:hypothetical protein